MERSILARRLELHSKLEAILGSNHVYFQPPESLKLKYPCIVYERSTGDTKYADNNPFSFIPRYELTFITQDPDSETINDLAYGLQSIRHIRHFKASNLNHDVFELFF